MLHLWFGHDAFMLHTMHVHVLDAPGFVVRKYLPFTGKLDFYWGNKFYRGSCLICLIRS